MTRRRISELLAALALLGGCVAAILMLPSGHAGRVVAGIVLVLTAGVAVAAALIPGQIGGPERVAIGLGGAFVAAIGVTLAIDASPWTLDATHWAIVLGGVGAIGAAAGAFSRGRALPATLGRWTPRARDVAVMALAAVVVAGAIVVGFQPAKAPAGTPGHTSLWLSPDRKDPRQVEVGVTGGDVEPTTYRVEVALDGRQVGQARRWTIGPTRTRSETITVPSGAGTRLTATLYRASDPSTPVRSVFLTLPQS